MREIKFRFWDKEYKIWLEPPSLHGEPCCASRTYGEPFSINHFLKGSIVELIKKEEIVIQQYTGLKDKNGKEIYEGDLVKSLNEEFLMASLFKPELAKYDKGQIKWFNEKWNVCQEYIGATDLCEYSECDCHPAFLEVIGNIFEGVFE